MDYLDYLEKFLLSQHAHTFLLFLGLFLLFLFAAYFGKLFFKRRGEGDKITDDEAKIILGAILSLLGLMIGFVLSISISGFDSRQQTEENEVIAIGNAFQRIQLINTESQTEINHLLKQYLDARIHFFESGISEENRQWRLESLKIQNKLWKRVKEEVGSQPNPINASILASVSELYSSQQNTMASWRHQIPNAAWFLLIFFGVCANIFIGFNVRGIKGNHLLIFILPSLITLALFMIAEIDIPGEGIVSVGPDNLITLQQDFFVED